MLAPCQVICAVFDILLYAMAPNRTLDGVLWVMVVICLAVWRILLFNSGLNFLDESEASNDN